MSMSPRLPFYQKVDGFIIPGGFSADVFRKALRYQPRDGDLFIASYPKTGTTWTQMIVYLIRSGGKPPLNIPDFSHKSPFLEMHGLASVEKEQRPYAIKTHLPVELTPYSEKAKYIYVTRNPKDTCVSYFHHTQTSMYLFEDGEFDVYYDLFLNGDVDYGDFFDHVIGWYERRHQSNLLFLTYEELKKDTEACVQKIAKFMGEEYEKSFQKDPDLMAKVLKYSGVQHMKSLFNDGMEEMVGDLSVTPEKIDAMNLPEGMAHARKFVLQHRTASSKHLHLIRKGMSGSWKGEISSEQARKLDEKTKDKLEGTELLAFWRSMNCL